MKQQTVYLIRHAEAVHNIEEKKAVQAAKAAIAECTWEEQERARRAVLNDERLKDARLSEGGKLEVRGQSSTLSLLHKISNSRSSSSNGNLQDIDHGSNSCNKFAPPQLVLVSPLRRALETATELFYNTNQGDSSSTTSSTPMPKFIALEALREKRTGFAADERSSVEALEQEFPHVDFSDLRGHDALHVMIGENNEAVRERGRLFLEETFAAQYSAHADVDSVALVTHKGWLRELRHSLKQKVDHGQLTVDFDVDAWHETLYKNAEVRCAQFGWEEEEQEQPQKENASGSRSRYRLASIVSRSIENAIGSVVENAIKHLLVKAVSHSSSLAAMASASKLNQEEDDEASDSDWDSDSDDDDDDDDNDDNEDKENNEEEEDDYFNFYLGSDSDDSSRGCGEEELVPLNDLPIVPPSTPELPTRKLNALEHPSPTQVTTPIPLYC